MNDLSPMIAQYLQIKQENPDTTLFFRLGDFYELFFDDAERVSKLLDLTLTSRLIGGGKRGAMCGVPFHSAETYISKLVNMGHKVAICEQLQDPKETKGLVDRGIVRIITKGSVIESAMLDEGKNNYIASIVASSDNCGICFADVSTGSMRVSVFPRTKYKELTSLLGMYSPTEIILNNEAAQDGKIAEFINSRLQEACELLGDEYFEYGQCSEICTSHFGPLAASSGLMQEQCGVRACGALLKYLQYLYKEDALNITDISVQAESQYMPLDYSTRRNLELSSTLRTNEKKGSLLWVLDSCKTSMGKRKLRSWIERPLVNPSKIIKRQNAVAELVPNPIQLSELKEALNPIYDIERLTTRIVMKTANAKDLNSLKQALSCIPAIKSILQFVQSDMLKKLNKEIQTHGEIYSLIDATVNPDAPFSVHEGGLINPGFNSELDELLEIQTNGKQILSQIEAQEKEKTGIPKLKIGFNRVFGYYIEVTNSYKAMVPDNYVRKQTLANAERYITPELKEHESKVLSSQERSVKLEYELFCQIRNKIALDCSALQQTADALACLDALCSFADAALNNNYCRPAILEKPVIDIKGGRHPVVEKMLGANQFVPNDTYLDCDECRTAIITGPNMAGKSTYMRQVALICLMAQIGSFVPADSATIGIVDNIFTRIGASDDLTSGQSTFMVEMSEVSNIISSATSRSLIILDEVGRGTSTFDGMSIARSCLEYITNKKHIGARTLFSTHYHELTDLENDIKGIKNYNISVKKKGDDLIFLRKIIPGKADGSYGIEAAKLAGLPQSVISNARKILKQLENEGVTYHLPSKEQSNEITLSSEVDSEIIADLKQMDINRLSPLEAMSVLNELIQKAKSNGDF